MDAQKSKSILIGVAVVCLLAAAVLLYRNFSGGPRIDRRALQGPVPMYCLNCKSGLEIPFNDYRKLMDTESGPRYDCPTCSQKTMVGGFKCVHCSTIFPIDYERNPTMRCFKCGRTNTDE